MLGWSAWTKSLATPEDWESWAGNSLGNHPASAPLPPSSETPMMLRRRATSAGRAALGAAIGLPAVKDARYILSTRYGELDRAASILSSLTNREPVSPADFSMSVHHGLTGLLSIALKNKKAHGAVSGGAESFCYGLLEAVTCIAERPERPVILIHYDERPESAFATLLAEPDNTETLVAAMCLDGMEGEDGITMTMDTRERDDGPTTSSHVLDFLRFVMTDASTLTSRGDRLSWEWSRV